MHVTSVNALRKLVKLESRIVKISPQGYKMSNGVEFCTVGLKGMDGIDYSIQAYGKEALQLHKEASMVMQPPIIKKESTSSLTLKTGGSLEVLEN